MATKKTAPAPAPAEVVIAYKGFDKNLVCSPKGKPFQYEIGKTYTHKGSVDACSSGFHACENPIDVFGYYSPFDSRYCAVELSGALSRKGDDSKIAAAKITITTEIGIPRIVADSVKFVWNLVKSVSADETAADKATGDSSTQAASGNYSTQAASGNSSTQAASGYSSKQAASGDSSTQAASGDSSTQAASGNSSTQAASGNSSTQAASGNSSTQAASGYSSKQAASGDSSKQAASGNYSTQELTGTNGVAMAAGPGGKAKAAAGGCFALRWDDAKRPRIAVAYVGENGIKADTWYTLDKSGAFVEV